MSPDAAAEEASPPPSPKGKTKKKKKKKKIMIKATPRRTNSGGAASFVGEPPPSVLEAASRLQSGKVVIKKKKAGSGSNSSRHRRSTVQVSDDDDDDNGEHAVEATSNINIINNSSHHRRSVVVSLDEANKQPLGGNNNNNSSGHQRRARIEMNAGSTHRRSRSGSRHRRTVPLENDNDNENENDDETDKALDTDYSNHSRGGGTTKQQQQLFTSSSAMITTPRTPSTRHRSLTTEPDKESFEEFTQSLPLSVLTTPISTVPKLQPPPQQSQTPQSTPKAKLLLQKQRLQKEQQQQQLEASGHHNDAKHHHKSRSSRSSRTTPSTPKTTPVSPSRREKSLTRKSSSSKKKSKKKFITSFDVFSGLHDDDDEDEFAKNLDKKDNHDDDDSQSTSSSTTSSQKRHLDNDDETSEAHVRAQAAQYAAVAARQYSSYFALKNPKREKSACLFHGPEIVLADPKHPLRTLGHYDEYPLKRVQIIMDLVKEGQFGSHMERARASFMSRSDDGSYSVKYLRPHLVGQAGIGPHAAADIILEVRILLNLPGHPNICPLYGLNRRGIASLTHKPEQWRDGFFMITDCIPQLLTDRLEQWRRKQGYNNNNNNTSSGGSRFSQRMEVALDISSALSFLHDRQIVFHIRPEKVGFDAKHSCLKLFNFSEARQEGMTAQDQSTFVTQSTNLHVLAYTAPEVVLADDKEAPITNRADVYGFAMVLWQIVSIKTASTSSTSTTGTNATSSSPLFGGGGVVHNAASHWEHVVQRQQRPKVSSKWPKEIGKLLQKCWDHAPRKRMSMKDVNEELEALLLF